MVARKRGDAEVFRITGAGPGLTDDIRKRQRRYAISMSIRTVSFLLAVLLWHVQTVFAVIALVLGGVLPYVAVVIANAGREGGQPLPPTLSMPTHPELGGPSEGDSPGNPADHDEPDVRDESDKADGRDAGPRTPEKRG